MRNHELIALSVIAAAMAVYVVLSQPAGRALPDTRLVPEARDRALVRVERRAGGATETFAVDDGVLAMVEPVRAPLDPAAVRDLAGTVELLSYRRALPAADAAERGLAPPRVALVLGFEGGATVELHLGAHMAESDQTWLARADRPGDHYLIDGYAGRALTRGGDALRSRRPLPTRHRDVTGVEISDGARSVVLSGRPLALHLEGGGRARVDADAASSILAGLDNLRLSRFVAVPDGAAEPGFQVRVLGGETRELSDRGPCPGDDGQRLVATSIGDGCVSEGALAELALVLDFADRLIDRSLVSMGSQRPIAITLEAGGVRRRLDAVGGGWRSDGVEVDHEAVLEWATSLASLPAGEPRRVGDAAAVVATVELDYGGDHRERVELLAGGLARRAGEPIAFPIADGGAALFDPRSPRFRDRAVWSRDPSAVRALRKRSGGKVQIELRRGPLLEDWSVSSGTVDRARVDALLEALARLRARAYVGGALGRVTATVEVVFDDGTRTLELGANCRARTADDPTVFELGEADCALVSGPWSQ